MKEKYLILNFHPLVFFYFFGIICIVTSIFLGIFALYGKIVDMEPLFVPGHAYADPPVCRFDVYSLCHAL